VSLLIAAACNRQSAAPKPTAQEPVAAVAKSKGVVYPWSVVAGGVDSPESIRAAAAADPVVAEHYGEIDPNFLHAQRLTEKREGHVSYRIKDKVYWTRRKVALAAGELVLTDGKSMVRGRCGNLVSPVARGPVAPPALEPPEIAMDTPVPAAQLMAVPPFPDLAETVETNTFVNPLPPSDPKEALSLLPSPEAEQPMPAAWVTGGGGGGGGFVAVGGGGGGSSTPQTPETPQTPSAPSTPPLTTVPPAEVPPPLVLIPLEPPVTSYLPPPTYITSIPPTTPEWPYPPTDWYPPPSYPPPPMTPPPPEGPPRPPSDPPSGPPLGGPPPGDPPPPSDPPVTPPSLAVPEPGAWILFVLGIAGVAAGMIRRKS